MGGLWLTFFLLGMSLGLYVPAMTNIIRAQGWGSDVVQWAWLAGPVASLLSPVAVGSVADHRFAAQQVLGWAGVLSSILLAAAFAVLDAGRSSFWFVALLFASSIVAAPLWSMITSVSMSHLKVGEREFPLVRLGGTIGWMVAGFVTSWLLRADSDPSAGYAGALVRMLGGVLAFTLPHTPPPGTSRSIRTLLGFDAFRLLRQRDHLVFFAATALLSMPLAAFYMWTPVHLADLGDEKPTSTMAWGQLSEIVAMLLMVSLMRRFRVKTLLMLALVLSAARYGLFAWSGCGGGMLPIWIGIGLHGMCYTFYFITAQLYLDRRVPVGMRSQAQGLLSLFSNGVGTLMGTMMVRQLYDHVVANDGSGWAAFWGLLGGAISILSLGFWLSYVGVPSPEKNETC